MSMFHYWHQWTENGFNYAKQVKAEGCPMPDCYFKGRPVYFGDVDCSGDIDEVGFMSASYCDTDEELSDDELYELSAQESEHLQSEWFEHQVGRAEYAHEGER